jgi:3-oxoacyl-[acyl-carrier protein] reductase
MDKTVVITGASRGLGLAMATTLARAGYGVIAVARKESVGIARLTSEHSGNVRFQAWDLADITSLGELARTVRQSVCGTLWGLVNNAGIGTAGVLSTLADNKIEELVRLNITSPITLTKYLVRPMMTTRAGRIVSVSSIVAGTGYSGLSVYSATKAALVGFTHSLAREVGPLGITVNAVAPGFVTTDMTDGLGETQREHIARRSALKRLASAEDVANAVEFLMSDGSRNITGTMLTVDAGNTA